jgi:hypothetical protein
LVAVRVQLRKVGATVEEGPDWIRVIPPTRDPVSDHRDLRRPPHGHGLLPGGCGDGNGDPRSGLHVQDLSWLFRSAQAAVGNTIDDRRAGLLVHFQAEDIRSRIVPDHVEIELAPDNQIQIDIGGHDARTDSYRGPASTSPIGDTMDVPAADQDGVGGGSLHGMEVSGKILASRELTGA